MFPFNLTRPSFRALPFLSSIPRALSAPLAPSIFTRGKAILAPRRVKWSRRHKGRVSIPTGGSLKGTVLAFGDYGLRTKGEGVRITAKQLQTAEIAVRQKLKVIKGAKLHLRVFPDIPVGVKVSRLPFRRTTVELNLPIGQRNPYG
jgi:Ribosomal protein L16p/L10e